MDPKAGTVITLPDGAFWLGYQPDFSNQLFVRKAYPEILCAREAYRKAGRDFRVTLVTGTPGDVMWTVARRSPFDRGTSP